MNGNYAILKLDEDRRTDRKTGMEKFEDLFVKYFFHNTQNKKKSHHSFKKIINVYSP